ncbi:tryptophan synthase subunit alpha [Campylobacter corcagiensis]|uniref:Tryptophan synthase alpha chain n=1 Tax=Campylobacter corcagiensis TaxID=1448857 RepID=A0A7M1LEV0_9BACT|nr:tryptophan synthase subunit alpha [Campylobacter corcagiensis]QKF65273.1 tryptophan synthase, alpha subunit [Campylobacter corcagiensis]QOQ86594.1 tryptophan synthase subunit alpha [Campylobacter corcagiensis]
MDKIKKAFDEKLKNGKKANIGYIVGGYPDLNYTKELINNLDKCSLDILEIGIPYTDPLADGKVIFDASFKACQNGVTTDDVFKMLKECKTNKCLVFLVYYNLVFSYGLESFVKKAKEVGISGLIVPDLPCEESDKLFEICKNHGLSLIPLISVTSEYRLPKLLEKSSGFIYAVGSIGVTGGKQTPINRLKHMVGDIKNATNLPVAVGFGIRTNDDVKLTKSYADGAIVGTSIVKLCGNLSVGELLKEIDEIFKD